jgi:FkbM family methyltransferase
MSWFTLARFLARCEKSAGFGRTRGLGRLLRKARTDRLFHVDDLVLFFNHRVAGCYDGILAGSRRTHSWGETETHRLVDRALECVGPHGITLIDVGANIGEFCIPHAVSDKVARVIAFEPQHECVRTVRVNAILNGLTAKLDVRPLALASAEGELAFDEDPVTPQASHLSSDAIGTRRVQCSTLDAQARDVRGPCMLKIDVEGAELEVLKGGREFVAEVRPLILFEHNRGQDRTYAIKDVQDVLAPGYVIYSLTGTGQLGGDPDSAWNCIALHPETPFHTLRG